MNNHIFYGIPLSEITKYLANIDFLSFRQVCRTFYSNTLNEFDKRKYCLSNVIRFIHPTLITRNLGNKDYKNFRLTNQYIANAIRSEINHRMPQYYVPHYYHGDNIYSFALMPDNHQPSGAVNFSRTDNATLAISCTSSYYTEVVGTNGYVAHT